MKTNSYIANKIEETNRGFKFDKGLGIVVEGSWHSGGKCVEVTPYT